MSYPSFQFHPIRSGMEQRNCTRGLRLSSPARPTMNHGLGVIQDSGWKYPVLHTQPVTRHLWANISPMEHAVQKDQPIAKCKFGRPELLLPKPLPHARVL